MNLNWTAEAKVLVVIVYYMILGVVVLTIFTNSITDLGDLTTATREYFRCEGPGTGNATACESERKEVERMVNIVPTTIAFVLLGLYPVFNLVYTVNVKELKTQLACMERKVEMPPPVPGNRPRSRESRMTGNIQSATPYPVSYLRNGEPQRTSSFSSVYARPSTFTPHPPPTT